MDIERAVIVRAPTRLEDLKGQFNTVAQTQFVIKSSGGDFDLYEQEHDRQLGSFDKVLQVASRHLKVKVLDREYLPSNIFAPGEVVIVVGRDGLVANTAKYVHNIPIMGVNPDPTKYDGVLLPFKPDTLEDNLLRVLDQNYTHKAVSMAQAKLSDGQRLLAFNDLFIGPRSHVSARYRIEYEGHTEQHSSSGVIVSTGAGSTGWLSSLFNQAYGMLGPFNMKTKLRPKLSKVASKEPVMKSSPPEPPPAAPQEEGFKLPWDTDRLAFVVREPFRSKASQTELIAGIIATGEELVIESNMPDYGVIFSDGVQADFLNFNSGTIARVSLAPERATLVTAPEGSAPTKKKGKK